MTSALAAFASAQQQQPEEEVVEQVVGNANVPLLSLAEFAKQMKQSPSNKTLLDVAKEHPTTSLLQVAQATQQENATKRLSMLAQELQQEEQDATTRRSTMIQQTLLVTRDAVTQEFKSKQAHATQLALQEAVDEYDDWQHEEAQAIANAASLLVAKQQETQANDKNPTAKTKAKTKSKPASTPTIKTLKDRLSSFQLNQLTPTQQRLFMAMLVDGSAAKPKQKKKTTQQLHRMDELAHKEKKKKKTRIDHYARLDDAKHCRFRPRARTLDAVSQKKPTSDDEEDDGKQHQDFVRRMEAAERARKEQIRRTREERAYNESNLDKKECPQCGNCQSYAELTQKRKKCPNCGVLYRSRLAWHDIAHEFFQKNQQDQAERQRWKQQQAAEAIEMDGWFEIGRILHPDHERLVWEDVQEAFFGRLHVDLMQRALKKQLMEEEIQQNYSFQPAISKRAHQLQLHAFEDRLRRDLEQRKLRQRQQTTEKNTAKQEKKKQPKPVPKQSLPTRSFQERLTQDLNKRRERMAINNTKHPNEKPLARFS